MGSTATGFPAPNKHLKVLGGQCDLGLGMAISSKSKSFSRRSAGALLLVGVLAGVTVGGGVGVIAASTSKSVTVCVDKNDQHMNYSKSGKCKSHQTKLVLNQTGAKGIAGAKGDTGAAGAKGETGAAGAKGADGTAGTNGTNGTNGTDGAAGTNGVAGTNATLAITQQSVCDGSDAGVVADELCKVGMTGPGGGLIFFVDYNDQYAGFDYLEAAPVGWGDGIAVGAGETTGSSTVDPLMKWCSNTSSLLGLNAWSNSAVGAGATNTSTADTTCTGGAIQASSDYAGGSKTDWFLPSGGEAMLMYTNLRQVGAGGFPSLLYRTSSEATTSNAWVQGFNNGGQHSDVLKSEASPVRPVRAF